MLSFVGPGNTPHACVLGLQVHSIGPYNEAQHKTIKMVLTFFFKKKEKVEEIKERPGNHFSFSSFPPFPPTCHIFLPFDQNNLLL